MIVTLRVPQTAADSTDRLRTHVDVECWWPDEWGLPVQGQRVSVEEGKTRLVRRVVLEPGGLPTAAQARDRGAVRVELEDQWSR